MTSLCTDIVHVHWKIGLIEVCLGKRSTKVGVMSEAETDAYKKMKEEIKKEEVDDNIQNNLPPCLMFAAKSNKHKTGPDEATVAQ